MALKRNSPEERGDPAVSPTERAVPGVAGANGSAVPLPLRFISARLLAVGLFVSFGEFEKHDFLALLVDIVQHPVRADSQPIFSGEL